MLTQAEASRLLSCEKRIAEGLETFMEVGAALLEIREARLYRYQFSTFEGYCQQRWNMTARRARQLSDASAVVQNIKGTIVPPDITSDRPFDVQPLQLPSTESQARPLTSLPKDQQAPAWSEVLDTAPRDVDDKPVVTAAHVQQVVDRRHGKPVVIEVEASRVELGKGDIAKACSASQFAQAGHPSLHVKIPRPFEHERNLYTVGQVNYSNSEPSEAEAYQLLYNKDFITGEQLPGGTYEGRVVVWNKENYILGPKIIFRAAVSTDQKRWPRPNAYGVFEDPRAIHAFSANGISAKIYALQIGADKWLHSSEFSASWGGHSGPLSKKNGVHEDRESAIMAAAVELRVNPRDTGHDSPSCIAAANKLTKWADEIYGKASRVRAAAGNQEYFALESESVSSTKSAVKPAAFLRTPLPAEKTEIESVSNLAYKKLQRLKSLLSPISPSWTSRIQELIIELYDFADAWKSAVSPPSPGGLASEKKSLSPRQQSAKDKAASSAARYVICREPMKGAVHPAARKPRYAPGWCLDPAKAKHYTIAEATERSGNDVIMSLEKALRRFARGL